MQYFTHIRAFFSLTYDSMSAEKKYPTAHKILYVRCGAVLKEKIFVTARQKLQEYEVILKLFNAAVTEIYLSKPY